MQQAQQNNKQKARQTKLFTSPPAFNKNATKRAPSLALADFSEPAQTNKEGNSPDKNKYRQYAHSLTQGILGISTLISLYSAVMTPNIFTLVTAAIMTIATIFALAVNKKSDTNPITSARYLGLYGASFVAAGVSIAFAAGTHPALMVSYAIALLASLPSVLRYYPGRNDKDIEKNSKRDVRLAQVFYFGLLGTAWAIANDFLASSLHMHFQFVNNMGRALGLAGWDEAWLSLLMMLGSVFVLYNLFRILTDPDPEAKATATNTNADQSETIASDQAKEKKNISGISVRINTLGNKISLWILTTLESDKKRRQTIEASADEQNLLEPVLRNIRIIPNYLASEADKSPPIAFFAFMFGIATGVELYLYMTSGHTDPFIQMNLYMINHIMVNLSTVHLNTLLVVFQALFMMKLALILLNKANKTFNKTTESSKKEKSNTPSQSFREKISKNSGKAFCASVLFGLLLFILPRTVPVFQNQPVITALLLTITLLTYQYSNYLKKQEEQKKAAPPPQPTGNITTKKTSFTDSKSFNITVLSMAILIALLGATGSSHYHELGAWICLSAILLALKPILIVLSTMDAQDGLFARFARQTRTFVNAAVARIKNSSLLGLPSTVLIGAWWAIKTTLQAAWSILEDWLVQMPVKLTAVIYNGGAQLTAKVKAWMYSLKNKTDSTPDRTNSWFYNADHSNTISKKAGSITLCVIGLSSYGLHTAVGAMQAGSLSTLTSGILIGMSAFYLLYALSYGISYGVLNKADFPQQAAPAAAPPPAAAGAGAGAGAGAAAAAPPPAATTAPADGNGDDAGSADNAATTAPDDGNDVLVNGAVQKKTH
jgi:hypothetical protein